MRIDVDMCRDPDLLAAEIRRLRAALEAEPLTLTDEEREAIGDLATLCESQAASAKEGMSYEAAERWAKKAATLRGLLERTQTTHATPGEGSVPERDSEREPDLRGPAVIVDGSVIGGFTFTGPFDTIDEAAEWHKTKRLAGHLGLPAAIALLEKPRQEVFDE